MTSSGTAHHQNQYLSVIACIGSVIREAELKADLVGQFLLAKGYVPSTEPADPTFAPSPGSRAFLLELGAALRIRQWEESGIDQDMNLDTGPSAKVMAEAANRFLAADSPDHPTSVKVLAASIRHLAREGRPALGADVVMVRPTFDEDGLDNLAELLWNHRHLAQDKEINV